MSNRSDERMWWLLFRISGQYGHMVAWDDDLVDDFLAEFPEAKKAAIYYMMGHHVSPMLNRAAKRAKDLGYISAGSIGNMDARSFNQRTWCRTWRLTGKGIDALKVQRAASTAARFNDPRWNAFLLSEIKINAELG